MKLIKYQFNIYLNVSVCVCSTRNHFQEENLVFIRAESLQHNFTLKIIDVPTKAGVLINSCKYTEEGLLWGERWCGSTFACCCSSFHHPLQEGEGRGRGVLCFCKKLLENCWGLITCSTGFYFASEWMCMCSNLSWCFFLPAPVLFVLKT